MTRQRKLQMFALAVTLNGAIALNFMIAAPALASSCTPTLVCIGPCGTLTHTQLDNICAQAEPGCTVSSAICLIGSSWCGTFPPVACQYS
jgi:hypothetical protein